MANGIWTSVSGAEAQSRNVDIIANNLANADTLGFKKDAPTFKEYLASAEREHDSAPLQPGPIRNQDLYPLDGRDQSFVVIDGTYSNFKQGGLRVTQSPLDIALDGPGFIEVATPHGSMYTKKGSLKLGADGTLETTEGYPVLSAQPGGLAAAPFAGGGGAQPGGQGPAVDPARFINLRDRGSNITINNSGDIYAGDQLIGRLSVVEFLNPGRLRKSGESLFRNADPRNIVTDPPRTLVRQGVLETSNVNPIEEMTNLIKANRLFEQDLKAMKTYGEIMGREANDIGKL